MAPRKKPMLFPKNSFGVASFGESNFFLDRSLHFCVDEFDRETALDVVQELSTEH